MSQGSKHRWQHMYTLLHHVNCYLPLHLVIVQYMYIHSISIKRHDLRFYFQCRVIAVQHSASNEGEIVRKHCRHNKLMCNCTNVLSRHAKCRRGTICLCDNLKNTPWLYQIRHSYCRNYKHVVLTICSARNIHRHKKIEAKVPKQDSIAPNE